MPSARDPDGTKGMRPGAALSLLGEKGGGDKSFYNNAVRDGDWLVFPRAWRKDNEMGGAKITRGLNPSQLEFNLI